MSGIFHLRKSCGRLLNQLTKKQTKNSIDVEDMYESDNSGSDDIFEDLEQSDDGTELIEDNDTDCKSRRLLLVKPSQTDNRLKRWLESTEGFKVQQASMERECTLIPALDLDNDTGFDVFNTLHSSESNRLNTYYELNRSTEMVDQRTVYSETINKFRYPRWIRSKSSSTFDQSEVFEAVSKVRHLSLDDDPALDVRLKRWRELTNIVTGPVISAKQ